MSLLALVDDTYTRVLTDWTQTGRWEGQTATWYGAAQTATVPGGLDSGTIRATLTMDGPVALTLRAAGADRMEVRVDPVAHTLALWRVTAGVPVMLVEAPGGDITTGQQVTVRVDVDGAHISLWSIAGERLVSASAYSGATSDVVGLTQLGDGRTVVHSVTVGPLESPRINWPIFSHRNAAADIALVPGTWEDTDINNPNIVRDPSGTYWMYYTGYSRNKAGGDDGVQGAGVASAPSLDGPWTKRPENPVIPAEGTGAWSQNGGWERLKTGEWLIAANANEATMYGPSMATWFYKAPSPWGPYTRTPARLAPYVGDPFLRWNTKTGLLEHWGWTYYAGGRYGTRWTSSDQGLTWSAPEYLIPRPGIHGVNSGEQAIFVAPGQDEKQLWVTTDFYPQTELSKGRGMLIGFSPDWGKRWFWHVAQTPAGSLGWDNAAAFDSFVAYDEARKRLYLYHSGSTERDSGVLNFSIQIGHCWADWDHTIPAIQEA